MTDQQIQRVTELRYSMLLLSQSIIEELEKDTRLSDMQHLLAMQKKVIEEIQMLIGIATV